MMLLFENKNKTSNSGKLKLVGSYSLHMQRGVNSRIFFFANNIYANLWKPIVLVEKKCIVVRYEYQKKQVFCKSKYNINTWPFKPIVEIKSHTRKSLIIVCLVLFLCQHSFYNNTFFGVQWLPSKLHNYKVYFYQPKDIIAKNRCIISELTGKWHFLIIDNEFVFQYEKNRTLCGCEISPSYSLLLTHKVFSEARLIYCRL